MELYTTLYEKPTEKHLYFHYTSAHHKPCNTKGPFGQFLRICRICTKNDGIKMIEYYLKRGYPFKSLKKYMLKACIFTQDELLQVKPKAKINTPVMVATFNPRNTDIKGFIHNNWNIIEHSNDCASTFESKPLIGFKRLPNLRNLLTKAEISNPPTKQDTQIIQPTLCNRVHKFIYCPLFKRISEVECKNTHIITKVLKVPKTYYEN